MPQLYLMHFFTQFFWFSIGFTFLYAYLLHNVIPTLAKNLKFRQKKLELLANDINKGKDGVSNLLGVYDNLISSVKSNDKIKFYDSLDDLIDNVDGLIISSPATTHFKIARKALKTLDVLIEKPIAMKISDVLALQKLEKESSWSGFVKSLDDIEK